MRFKAQNGFSILEFMLVVILVSILAAIVVPRFAYENVTRQKVYAVAHNMAADLRYARRLSIGRGQHGGGSDHWFKLYTVGTATDTFRVFENGDEANPIKEYTVPGNDIVISASATDSFYFDYKGDPVPATGGAISVSDKYGRCQWDVSVIRNTGRVRLIQIR